MKDKPLILIKYGGNAMLSDRLKMAVIDSIARLHKKGYGVILVHGGGPFIKKMLDTVDLKSEFVGGHRKTSPEALRYIEMTLKGEVNSSLVKLFNQSGLKAVGISGKDGTLVTAEKRQFHQEVNGQKKLMDLGQVGDVMSVDTRLLDLLLAHDYIPVITCLASDTSGNDFNINADMFAGHIAGAMKVDQLLVLTDVDGLMEDINKPDSLINKIDVKELESMYGKVIKGGMIPKVESCEIALKKGAKTARIINGTKPENIYKSIQSDHLIGTEIC